MQGHLERAIPLGGFAAALVLQRDDDAKALLAELRAFGRDREEVRETILQTYLFDGYPTALEGMILLSEEWPGEARPVEAGDFGDWTIWEERGRRLYERIYGEVAPRLQERARAVSPELARWMIVEGYGKVLARGGMDLLTRELVIVAVLAVKNRPRQLHSHLRGALRVGATRQEARAFLSEILGRFAPELTARAISVLDGVRV